MKIIKILLMIALVLILSSCGEDRDDSNNKKSDSMTSEKLISAIDDMINEEIGEEVEEVEGEYGDLTEFINPELTDEKKEELKKALLDRKDRQELIKKTLTDALKDGSLEKSLEEVRVMRAACVARISTYISEEKIEDFNTYCDSLEKKLEEKFLSLNNKIEEKISENETDEIDEKFEGNENIKGDEDNKEEEKKIVEKSPIEDIRIYNGK